MLNRDEEVERIFLSDLLDGGFMLFYSFIWQAQTSTEGVYIFYRNKCEVIGHKEICWDLCYSV